MWRILMVSRWLTFYYLQKPSTRFTSVPATSCIEFFFWNVVTHHPGIIPSPRNKFSTFVHFVSAQCERLEQGRISSTRFKKIRDSCLLWFHFCLWEPVKHACIAKRPGLCCRMWLASRGASLLGFVKFDFQKKRLRTGPPIGCHSKLWSRLGMFISVDRTAISNKLSCRKCTAFSRTDVKRSHFPSDVSSWVVLVHVDYALCTLSRVYACTWTLTCLLCVYDHVWVVCIWSRMHVSRVRVCFNMCMCVYMITYACFLRACMPFYVCKKCVYMITYACFLCVYMPFYVCMCVLCKHVCWKWFPCGVLQDVGSIAYLDAVVAAGEADWQIWCDCQYVCAKSVFQKSKPKSAVA